MITSAGDSPAFDSTTPQAAPAASLKTEYSLSRSTAQNSQPMLEACSAAAWQAGTHWPIEQARPFLPSHMPATPPGSPSAPQARTVLPSQNTVPGVHDVFLPPPPSGFPGFLSAFEHPTIINSRQ